MADLKVGVIGCGGHAQSHFRMIAAEPRLRLVGIAELDEERRRKNQAEWKPQHAFADYREMLDVCRPEVVHIVTMPGHLLPIVLYRIQRAEVHGENLSIYLDMTRGPQVEGYDAGRAFTVEADEIEAVGGAGFNEVVHFVDCILADRTPWSNLDDAVHTMRLCEAIRRGHRGAL